MKSGKLFAFPMLLPLLLATLCLPVAAEPEALAKWTNPEGRLIEAEFVDLTDEHVLLKMKGQAEPIKVAHAKLSAESLAQARLLGEEKKKKAEEEAAATKGKFKFADQWVPRGQKTEVMVEIPSKEAVKFLSDTYGKPTTRVRVNLIVPENFDPADQGSLAVFCHETYGNGKGLSVGTMRVFQKVALQENAIVLAADGEFGNPGPKESPNFRAFLAYSALQALLKDHPAAAQWRYIHAGNSGGSGYASYTAMYMVQSGYRVAGCFMGVSDYSPVKWDGSYKLKAEQKKQLRFYYSLGKNDPVCTPESQDRMLAELRKSPYKSVRVVYHERKHGFEESHWNEAFQWFKTPMEK